MDIAMDAAVSAALIYQTKMDVLANNLANVNTLGFKQDHTAYLPPYDEPDESLNFQVGPEEPLVPDPESLISYTNFAPGQLKATGNPLDMALDGDGFFCVQTPEGTQYSRKGNFSLNSEGVLVNQEGLAVLGEGGPIQIQGQDIRVDGRGNIQVDGQLVDILRVVRFPDTLALKKVADTCFVTNDPAVVGVAADNTQVKQGYVEASNVDTIRMMTEMIDVLRGFESYQRVIQSINEVILTSINEVGTLA